MATQLNQLLAVEKGVKASAAAAFAAAQQALAKPEKLSGISRTYQPKDEDGDQFPPESTRVQVRVTDVLGGLRSALTRLFDVTLTKDVTNGTAVADILVDGQVIAEKVPATTLIFLEKQLADLGAFVARLPVLDPAESWTYDPNSDANATEPAQTHKTKKVLRNHVKAEATDRFPAQVEVYSEDVVVGYWTTTKFSGALPLRKVTDLAARVAKLAEAVKVAREAANTAQVIDRKIGAEVFQYLFPAE